MVPGVPTAPGGLPGLGVMPRYAQADLLPDFKPPVGLQKQISALIKSIRERQGKCGRMIRRWKAKDRNQSDGEMTHIDLWRLKRRKKSGRGTGTRWRAHPLTFVYVASERIINQQLFLHSRKQTPTFQQGTRASLGSNAKSSFTSAIVSGCQYDAFDRVLSFATNSEKVAL